MTDPSPPRRPLVSVSVAVWRGGEVLLVRRARAPLAGKWSLPGGHVEWGERLKAAAARELREETAIEAEILDSIDIAEIIGTGGTASPDYHYVLIVFAGRYLSGAVKAADDAAEARWVRRDETAGLDLTVDTARILGRGPP